MLLGIHLLGATTGQVDDIRAIATLASVSLALLIYFSRERAEAAPSQIDALSPKTFLELCPDFLLFLLSALPAVAMASLCFGGFSFSDFGHSSGALTSMFALVWFGFVALAGYQALRIASHLFKAGRNLWSDRRS